MTTEVLRSSDFLAMVDYDKGTVDRKMFSDQAIYDMELERIFARAWNFMCHDSQVPNAGDFFLNYIGEDRVIVVRDKDGGVQVLLNTCRHRGNAVCRAEEGHATSFMCTYHGWTYDLKGHLVGVPGFKDYYHEDLDRESWGLVSAAKVDSYHGFIFATLDADAPDLYDYLGEVGRAGINLIAARGPVRIVGGIQKYTIGCNWKLAVDNLFDWYHPVLTHASAIYAGMFEPPPSAPKEMRDKAREVMQKQLSSKLPHFVAMGPYGHAIGGPAVSPETDMMGELNPMMKETWRETPEGQSILGPLGRKSRGHPNIFPNLWVTSGQQLSLRIPKGPFATEIWWFSYVAENLPPEVQAMSISMSNRVFGPAGMLEQEDGENWDQSTRGTLGTVARRYPLNFGMGVGHGEVQNEIEGAAYIETKVNEHAQLWTYKAWTEWMAAESWAELKQIHSPAPSGLV